jgi:hypothetical protein
MNILASKVGTLIRGSQVKNYDFIENGADFDYGPVIYGDSPPK